MKRHTRAFGAGRRKRRTPKPSGSNTRGLRRPAGAATGLKRELDLALHQQTATSEVLRAISGSSFELQNVLDRLVEAAMRLCDADSANIWRPKGDILELAASCGHSTEFKEFAKRNPITPGYGTVTGRVFLEGKTKHLPDVLADPAFVGIGYQSRGNYRTHLGVPLLRDGEAIGAFALTRVKVRPYSDRQIELATTFADQAVVAIENARRLSELRQRTDELDRSLTEMRALEEVSQTANSTLELEKVLSTIIEKAVQLSGTEAGAIYVYDDVQREFHMRATYGMEKEIVDALTSEHIGLDEPHVKLAFASGDPIQAADLREGEASRVSDIILRSGYRALLVAPLSRADSIVGFLVVRRRAPGAFSRNIVALIKTLAAQSVLPIRNARLFETSLQTVQAELARVSRLTTLGQLTASIAHEVTQPIASSRNNARAALNFLDQHPLDLSEVKEALECVVADADRAGDIIERIRDQIKKAHPRKDRFDLNKAINEVIVLARSAITENEVSVQTRLTEGSLPVQGDRVQVQQVILNLILNAVEAMGSGEAGARELLISTEQSETNGIVVAVGDSGPGIDPEDRERVFQAFYTTKSSGVGIGLSICRSIIEAHGGRLWTEANEPRGAVFQFTLPSVENELTNSAIR